MTVYMMVEIQVHDPALYSEYMEQVPETVRFFGGRYLARTNQVVPISGNWIPERIILLEFPSLERLQAWWRSDDYQALAPLRQLSTDSRAIVFNAGEPADVG